MGVFGAVWVVLRVAGGGNGAAVLGVGGGGGPDMGWDAWRLACHLADERTSHLARRPASSHSVLVFQPALVQGGRIGPANVGVDVRA